MEVKVKWLTVYDSYLTGLKADKPEVHGIDDCIAYFECIWLGSQFAPAKWNVYSGRALDDRRDQKEMGTTSKK